MAKQQAQDPRKQELPEKLYSEQELHRGKWSEIRKVKITPEQAAVLNKDTKATKLKYVEVKKKPAANS